LVAKARKHASDIALDTQKFIEQHSSVTIERTLARLFGIDGVDEFGVPLPNILVDHIKNNNGLSLGVSVYLGNVIIQTGKTAQEIAESVSKGELELTKLLLQICLK
jgi:beta-lysine 5,6-aminomutase alpha subunit